MKRTKTTNPNLTEEYYPSNRLSAEITNSLLKPLPKNIAKVPNQSKLEEQSRANAVQSGKSEHQRHQDRAGQRGTTKYSFFDIFDIIFE